MVALTLKADNEKLHSIVQDNGTVGDRESK